MILACKYYTFCIIIFRFFTSLKYMRARILAIIILILLIVLPVSLYYYLTKQKIAKLTLQVNGWVSYSAHLRWTFWVDGLPLADTMLSYQQDCIDVCIFSPILPARYTLTLTASWKTSLSDSISINTGDQIVRSYTLSDELIFTPVWSISKDDTVGRALIDNALSQKWWEFTLIGTDIKNRVWVMKKWESTTDIGILTPEWFSSSRNISAPIISQTIDTSQSVLMLGLAGDKSLYISVVNPKNEIELPTTLHMNIVSVIPGDSWRILTSSGTFELKWDRLVQDIRFTNSIDISPQIRIGYIDKRDTTKLSLGNFPLTDSLLIRLDRVTGQSIVLRRGIDIRTLFYYDGVPAYIDLSGKIYTILEK